MEEFVMSILTTRFEPYLNGGFDRGWDRLFEDVLGDIGLRSYSVPKATRKSPSTNVHETETGYEISIVAPGLKKSDFNVLLENGVLAVSCEGETKRGALSQGSFKHSWKAPKDVIGEDIAAKYDAGILTVTVSKPASQQPIVETIEVM
tara:strand:- start:109 stop:552 length:444 start_codon:yes stop_codon:yes gene_type:complete